MSYQKIQIESIEIATTALTVAKNRMGVVLPANIPFDAGTIAAIPLALADILLKKSNSDIANGNLARKNAEIDGKYLELRGYQNSFFGVLNFKIKDDIYPKEIRTPFGIALNDTANPYNDSNSACELLVGRMTTGNLQIIADLLPLMVDYNSAHAVTLLGQIMLLKSAKIALEEIANTKTHELQVSYATAKALVESIWAQADLFYRLLEAAAKRDAERNWGVVYELSKVETELNIKAKIAVTNADANGSTWHLGKVETARGNPGLAGVTATIEANGVIILKTTQDGELLLTGKLADHHDISEHVTLVAGTNQSFSFTFTPLP